MGFYIKKVTAHSAVNGDASVTFGKGLNIVQGKSDSGKSCVAACIDFIYGGATELPFKESAKYESVTMTVGTDIGDIVLHRLVGKKTVTVTSENELIESGVYDVEYKKNAKNPPLNIVWLKLMGINEEPKIISNVRFVPKRLTWKNLLRVFYLDENRIDDADSVIEPTHRYMENTLFLSALLYLFTGRSFTEEDAKEKREIKKSPAHCGLGICQ